VNEYEEMGAKTHKLVEDTVLFTQKNVTMLQHALSLIVLMWRIG